jgi:polyisoprenoid-binding protein YceI
MSETATTTQTPLVQSWSVWHIETAHSLAEFSIRHMMVSNVKGRFTGLSGTIIDAGDDPKLSSVNFNGLGTTPYGKTVAGFTAETKLNRKEFGLHWNVALEAGGFLVGDQLKINLEVEAVRQDPEPVAEESGAPERITP